MAYNEVWDPNTPQGSEARALGDDRIREMKRALQERLATIMNFPDGSPLELLPSYVDSLGLHDGTQLDDASIPSTKIQSLVGSKITDASVSWTKLTNDTRIRLGYIYSGAYAASQSSNHPSVDIVVPDATTASWNYPIGSEFAPHRQGHSPNIGFGAGVTVNISSGQGSNTLPANMHYMVRWTGYFDGSQLIVTCVNQTGANVTIRSGFGWLVTFTGTFTAPAADGVTGTFGNPTV